MELTQGHPIKVAVRRTGLSSHVIRVWEKRYQAVVPARSATNRRLYSEEDIMRLWWLRQAVRAGQSIGRIAHHSTAELVKLVNADWAAAPSSRQQAGRVDEVKDDGEPTVLLQRALEAVTGLNPVMLEEQLLRTSIQMSQQRLLEEVVHPLMERIGELWQQGTLRIADEHMATAVVRSFIGNIRAGCQVQATAPHALATTPAGQMHEMGALLASAVAAAVGWNSTFLGPNLPAEEIAGAATKKGAKVVLLSIVHPADDPRLGSELVKLGRLLGGDVFLLAGGRAARNYLRFLNQAGAVTLNALSDLHDFLNLVRREPPARALKASSQPAGYRL